MIPYLVQIQINDDVNSKEFIPINIESYFGNYVYPAAAIYYEILNKIYKEKSNFDKESIKILNIIKL